MRRAKKAAPAAARRRPTVPRDPVTRYAWQVTHGQIVAGRAVRLLCARHLRDLERQRTPEFPYYFDKKAAQHVIDFFPTFLTLENGDPFVLPPWLQFCYGSIFGWKRVSDDLRKYKYGYFETSKGSGKTPSAGGIGLYGMLFDDEPFAEIYSAAFDKGQASIILNDAIRMADASEDLLEVLDVGKYNISNPENGSWFRAMSSEHRGKSGPRPYYVLGDEAHEWRDGAVFNKLVSGFKRRRQPLALIFTNSGSSRQTVCWEYHQKSIDVLEGVLQDEQWFGYVCHLDPCEKCFADGHRQPRDGCTECDNWLDPAVWPKVAPALGVVIQPQYMQDAIDRALSTPSEYNLVRRLNFCLWTDTHVVWIPPDYWNACEVDQVAVNLDGARAAAFDMSEKLDLTACVVGIKTHAPDDPVEQVEIIDVEDDQEVRKVYNLNFYLDLVTYFWLPEETLHERVTKERIPYDIWRNGSHPSAGPHLRVTPGPVIDYDQIYREFTTEIVPRYRPQRVGYDPHNATQFALQLRDKKRLTVVEIAQGRKLSEAFKLFEALVRLRRVRHAGNPVMGFCVANAEPKRDRYQNLWVEKPSQTKRIDGLVAAVMVLSLLMVMPVGVRRKGRIASVWTPGGFVPVDRPADTPGDGVDAHL